MFRRRKPALPPPPDQGPRPAPITLDGSEPVMDGFRRIAANGWGDGLNSYAHSMAYFNDHLYVGSARANLYLISRRTPKPAWPIYPVNCPADPFVLDCCAQIWRFDPREQTWRNVHRAPMVVSRDNTGYVPRDIGYRGMQVFQGPKDDAPALYVTSYSPTRGPGPMVLRSPDGETFTPVSEPGLGYAGISAFRALVPYKGRMYTSPIGSTRNRANESSWPMVFETDDPQWGKWRPVSDAGFGNPHNTAVFEITVFNGYLYGGTLNVVSGFEIWKTDAEGEPPYKWKKVMDLGAYRGNLNEGALSMCVFKDGLYIGTAIQDGGFDRANQIGPAAGEVIRINKDDTWELVMGNSRLTPRGFRIATSGLGPGFGNFFSTYIWRMCVHDGWLYVGTWDWSAFLPYAPFDKWPQVLRDMIDGLGVDNLVQNEGGFDLWRTENGDDWFPVTRTGFGNQYNCGIRTMVSTPYGLALGAANPFGGEVAVKRDGRWRYEANPRGGLEVWLGAPPPPVEAEQSHAGGKDAEKAKPQRRGHARVDQTGLDLSIEEMTDMRKRIDIKSVMPEEVAFARKYHDLSSEGMEHVPKTGPCLIVCNHLATPFWAWLMVEDTPIIAHLLLEHMGRPARILGALGFYRPANVARVCKRTVERLGFVPATLGNGLRLLEMGEAVFIHPEGDASGPPYRIKALVWGFAKLAYATNSPVIPGVLVGPHESRPPIVRKGKQIIVNMHRPLQSKYKLIFLPPLDVREHVSSAEDKAGFTRFCELVRGQMQAAIDREIEGRPLVKLARDLQARYGDPQDEN